MGRGGVLKAITIQSHQDWTNSMPLHGLMSGVSFKDGCAYGDYRDGDYLASLRLVGLITGETPSEPVPARNVRSSALALGFIGGFTLVCGAGVVWVVKKRHRRDWRRFETEECEIEKQETLMGVNENHLGGKQKRDHKLQPQRMFNYQQFYSDLVMQVSRQGYKSRATMPVRNGTSLDSNQQIAENEDWENLTALVSQIEIQNNLIEEQQRLIRELTKLVQKKG
jgi:hypothetical protein